MPVFQAMQPQIHEQQSGGGGGYSPGSFTMPRQFDPVMPYGQQAGVQQPMGPVQPGMSPGMAGGAQNPAPGGSPYTYGAGFTGPGGQTAQEPFNPLSDPAASIVRGLLNMGLNPAAPTYGIGKLLARADDIVRGLAGRLATSGNENMLTGEGFQGAVNALLSSGGPVISGREEGQRVLQGLNSLVNTAIGGGGSEGARFLASILGPNPQAATGFADALLYGGASPSVRNALKRELLLAPDRFTMMAETTPGFEQTRNRSALDILLSGMLGQGAQAPFGTTGYPGGAAPLGAGGMAPTPPALPGR